MSNKLEVTEKTYKLLKTIEANQLTLGDNYSSKVDKNILADIQERFLMRIK